MRLFIRANRTAGGKRGCEKKAETPCTTRRANPGELREARRAPERCPRPNPAAANQKETSQSFFFNNVAGSLTTKFLVTFPEAPMARETPPCLVRAERDAPAHRVHDGRLPVPLHVSVAQYAGLFFGRYRRRGRGRAFGGRHPPPARVAQESSPEGPSRRGGSGRPRVRRVGELEPASPRAGGFSALLFHRRLGRARAERRFGRADARRARDVVRGPSLARAIRPHPGRQLLRLRRHLRRRRAVRAQVRERVLGRVPERPVVPRPRRPRPVR